MFRFLLNFIGFLLSFVFTEKIMHEVWHLRNVTKVSHPLKH